MSYCDCSSLDGSFSGMDSLGEEDEEDEESEQDDEDDEDESEDEEDGDEHDVDLSFSEYEENE